MPAPAAPTLTPGAACRQRQRPGPAPTHLLYLHGFRSSPRSFKAQRLQAWLAVNHPALVWCCPQLPPSPREAMALIGSLLARWPAGCFAVAGSSLGGFYATAVAEAHGCPAVLLNPAVDPARDLAAHIGEQTAWHDPAERFLFRPEYVDELRALTVPAITRPERYLVVVAKGDEVLDWQEMQAFCASGDIRLLEGGDHAISDFDQHIDTLFHFLNLHTG